jgi:hypothetical protein
MMQSVKKQSNQMSMPFSQLFLLIIISLLPAAYIKTKGAWFA